MYGLTPPEPQRQAQAAAERYVPDGAKTERITADTISGPSPEEILNSLRRPGWRTIIGAPGSDVPYRQWLKQQSKFYQKLVNDVVRPEEINESINEFLATQ